jgi:hypothetical protein
MIMAGDSTVGGGGAVVPCCAHASIQSFGGATCWSSCSCCCLFVFVPRPPRLDDDKDDDDDSSPSTGEIYPKLRLRLVDAGLFSLPLELPFSSSSSSSSESHKLSLSLSLPGSSHEDTDDIDGPLAHCGGTTGELDCNAAGTVLYSMDVGKSGTTVLLAFVMASKVAVVVVGNRISDKLLVENSKLSARRRCKLPVLESRENSPAENKRGRVINMAVGGLVPAVEVPALLVMLLLRGGFLL